MAVTTETSWFDAAGQLLAKAVPALDNKTTRKYSKNQKAAVSDWGELVLSAVNGEGQPAPDVLRAVAANMGMEPERAMATFSEDAELMQKAIHQMKRLPKVVENRNAALNGLTEKQAFQKLSDEKEELRRRTKEIHHANARITQTGMGIANCNVTIDNAARNARLFPNGRADVVEAAGFSSDPFTKETKND